MAARLYTSAPQASRRETAGDLLRAVTAADRAVQERTPDAPTRLKLVRDLVLAAAGGVWRRESEKGRTAAARLEADLRSANTDQAAAFDRSCAGILRARFPAETATTAA